MVPIPKDQYGSFYNGDAYIIYSATEYGQPGGVKVKVRNMQSKQARRHFGDHDLFVTFSAKAT